LRQRVLFVLRRIRHATRWTLFSDSTPAVWAEVDEQITGFLHELYSRSILVGERPSQACFVKCDADTNAGLAGRSGEVAFVVGFALRRSGEFLAFRFHHSHGSCRISELGWQAGFAQAS